MEKQRPSSGPRGKNQKRPKSTLGIRRVDATLPNNDHDDVTPILHRPATVAGYRSQVHGGQSNGSLESLLQTGEVNSKEKLKQLSSGGLLGETTTSASASVISLPVLKDEPSSTVTLAEYGSEEMELEQRDLNIPERVSEEHHNEEHSSLQYTVDYNKIHHLLDLTEGETDFDSDKEIPDIFVQVDQLQQYSNIKELKGEIEKEKLKTYLHEFTDEMQNESLMVGKFSREKIEEEERQLQLEHLAYQEQEASKQRERQKQITASTEVAKREVNKALRKRRYALKKKEAQVVQSSMVHHKQLYSAFSTAQKQMITAVNAHKAEVKTLYGDLQRADGYYGAIKGRRWKVDWSKAPQPVQIKIKSLRGIRDKLPASRYVLLVSLYDRLGGHVLRWSKLKGHQWGTSTVPVDHQGHYYNTDVKLNQSVYTALPSKTNVRPSMVLLFELFVLRGAATPTDRVVGWGVFPVCDADFRIIEGKYKCPFLRGPVDPQITKHGQIEKLMATDLENWLCNLYFEVIKLPRYLTGMHEYEVELQFSSTLLGHPDRTHDERGVVDGNEHSFGLANESLADDKDIHDLFGSASPLPSSATMETSAAVGPGADTILPGTGSTTQDLNKANVSRGPLSSRLSRRLHSGYADESDSTSSSEGEEMGVANRVGHGEDHGFSPVIDRPGMYYKVHHFNPLEEKQRTTVTMFPSTPLLQEAGGKQKRKKVISEEEDLQQHTIAVKTPFSDKGRVKRRMNQRLQYVGRQFISEFGVSQWKSLEFWSMVVILVLSWWIRLYLHYVAQYGFLRAVGIPVNRFEFFPHTVILNYQSSLLFTRETIAIIILGPLFNTVIFCLLILLSWIFQLLFGGFPDLGSQFITAFGVQALLDPYWIFVVDMALQRYQTPLPDAPTADATKLYWHFVRLEGSGVIGIFLLIFLYLFVTFVTLACLYMFFLKVHMNGRLIDIYHRLKSPEEMFFLPRDMEVSNQELGYVCRKAEQWRGAEGERRKVAVHDYVWMADENELKVQKKPKRGRQVTNHVSIHTLHLDGLRELYRHFLCLEDGSIIEIFGELSSVPGISPGLKNALTKNQQHSQENCLPIESTITASPQVLQSTPVKERPVRHFDSPGEGIPASQTDFGNGSQEKGIHSLPVVKHTSTEASLNDTSTVIEVETSFPEDDEGLSRESAVVSPVGSDVPLLAGEDSSVSTSGWGRRKDKNRRDRSKVFEKKLSAGKMV